MLNGVEEGWWTFKRNRNGDPLISEDGSYGDGVESGNRIEIFPSGYSRVTDFWKFGLDRSLPLNPPPGSDTLKHSRSLSNGRLPLFC